MNRKLTIALVMTLSWWMQPVAADALDSLPDPTRPMSFHGTARQSGGSGLQATVVSPDRNFAIIGGRTVNVGDRVGHAVVTEIRPYEITLTSSTGVTVMRMMPPLTRTITKTASETPLER